MVKENKVITHSGLNRVKSSLTGKLYITKNLLNTPTPPAVCAWGGGGDEWMYKKCATLMFYVPVWL